MLVNFLKIIKRNCMKYEIEFFDRIKNQLIYLTVEESGHEYLYKFKNIKVVDVTTNKEVKKQSINERGVFVIIEYEHAVFLDINDLIDISKEKGKPSESVYLYSLSVMDILDLEERVGNLRIPVPIEEFEELRSLRYIGLYIPIEVRRIS